MPCRCRADTRPPPASALTVAGVLRAGLPSYTAKHKLSAHQWKTVNALLACRTPQLGGHLYHCADCQKDHPAWNSCRNRHCPNCQGRHARRWLAAQQALLLPVPYFHLVFTLPHALNPLIAQNQKALYTLLFQSASATLLEFGRQTLQAQLGLTAVLHTWSQTLLDHYHLHVIATGGGVSLDGARWVHASPHYLFPVQALSVMFRAKFRDGLRALHAQGGLGFHGTLTPLAQPRQFAQLVAQVTAPEWVVFAKRPFAGPKQVFAYLSRYTHRVALSNRRLISLDRQNQTVTFAYKDYADNAARKTMPLSFHEFVRRFLYHVLPPAFVKIRHYGLLGNRHRHSRIAQARQLLGVTDALLLPPEEQSPKPVCPYCGGSDLSPRQRLPPQPIPFHDSS